MFSRILVGLCTLFLYIGLLPAEKPTVVSLGPNCQVAHALRYFGIRQQAFPFDWVLAFDIEAATQAIDNHFWSWLDPQFLLYDPAYIINQAYNVRFNHDFPPLQTDQHPDIGEDIDFFNNTVLDPNFLAYLPAVTQKYEKRIQRLYNLLQSNQPIMFMCTYASPQMATQFVTMIKSKFPFLNFTLVVVNPSCPNKHSNVNNIYTYKKIRVKEWHIPHVKVMYAYDYDPQFTSLGWWTLHEWQGIFTELGLLANEP